MSAQDWIRVSRTEPCPICGKPDWCCVSVDGSAALCQRVRSDHAVGDAGYLHRLGPRKLRGFAEGMDVKPQAPKMSPEHCLALAREFQAEMDGEAYDYLAARLGVSAGALPRLCVGFRYGVGSWTFPMRAGDGQFIGIQLRGYDGSKKCIRGSAMGLFIPVGDHPGPGSDLWAPEGASDCAALLGLGLVAVGRQNCSGGRDHLVELVRRRCPSRVIIVADRDKQDKNGRVAGQDGAEKIASAVRAVCADTRIIMPPGGHKDSRIAVCAGATRADFEALAAAASKVGKKVTVTYRRGRRRNRKVTR